MPFLFKLAKRVARLRSRPFLVAVAVVAGACAKEVASLGAPADGTPPVTIQLPSADAAPGASVAVVFRATEPLAAIQETVAFDPQRLRYERPGNGPDLVVVNDEAAAQGSLRVLATNPQGLAPTGVTLVFTVTASGYTEGVRGTVELAVAPDDGLVWGAAPGGPSRVAGASQAGGYRFGDANLDGLINVWDVLLLGRASAGTTTLTAEAFFLANVRPVNGGAAATGMPPCDPTTTCRPGVTPADAQSPNGLIDDADAAAVASLVVGVSVPVVGELAPTGPSTPTAVASVTVSPPTASISVGQLLPLTATPKDSAGAALTGRTVMWTSSNAGVATVSSSGLVTGSVAGTATITAISEGKTGSAAVTVAPVPVASVTISPTASIRVGQTVQLTATLKDSTGSTLAGRTVTWTSGNTSAATVSPSGLVTGVAQGSAAITATSEGKSSTATITVALVPVASVTVSPSSGSLQVGQTVQLTATPKDSTGNTLAGRAVTWTSGNPSVATVSSSGQVTGVAQGSATITATSEGKSSTAAITVTSVPVASVLVSPATASIGVGQTVQLTATLKDSTGNTLTGRTVMWGSGDTTVARVSLSGLMTGVAEGSATITATSEGKSSTATITVALVPVASVTVSPSSGSLQVGQTVQLTATPKDSTGNTLAGRAVTWTSGNPSVATVSSSGLVSGVAQGSATITATSEGESSTAAINVTNVPVASVTVSPSSGSLQVGQTVQLTATLKDSTGNTLTGRTVMWGSGETTVARVSLSGLMTGVAEGSATITATSEGKSSTATITVALVPVASVAVSPATASVAVGQTLQLAAMPKDSAGAVLNGRTVTWMSDNPSVATVSSSGLVSGVAQGSATITATSEGKSRTAAVTGGG